MRNTDTAPSGGQQRSVNIRVVIDASLVVGTSLNQHINVDLNAGNMRYAFQGTYFLTYIPLPKSMQIS